MSLPQVPGPAVLRNRGVPVLVHVLARDAEHRLAVPYQRTFDEADEPILETRWIQFTNAVLADIEARWGDTDSWQGALSDNPYRTLAETLAIAFGEWHTDEAGGPPTPDVRLVGTMMRDGIDSTAYSTAILGAYLLSQGVEPERVGESLRREYAKAAETAHRIAEVLATSLDEPQPTPPSPPDATTPTSPTESPSGEPPSPTGPDSEGTGTSSGD